MQFLEKLIEATAWPMERPASYGPFHLIFTFVGLALCILAAYLLRKTDERGNRIVLWSVGGFLAITELYKQLFYYFYIGDHSYQWWIFPFQLCSVPMYLCLIAPFLKKGKVQSAMYHFMTTFNLLGGAIAFAEPSGLTHEYWTLTLHAFVWHMLLVFIGFYLIASGRGAKTMKDYGSSVVVFLCLAVVAFVINLIFWAFAPVRDKTDFATAGCFLTSESGKILIRRSAEKSGLAISACLKRGNILLTE